MTLLVMPTLNCNLRCAYCSWRYKGYEPVEYQEDPEKMALWAVKVAQETRHREVVLHGGEPLLWPIPKLEKFMETVTRMGYRIGIQTNATLITNKHIELFKRYNVGVGVSIDGDPEIGTSRGFWRPDGESLFDHDVNKNVVRRVATNLEKMANAGIQIGVIIVLSKINASPEKVEKLAGFIKWLKSIGVTSGRLNPAFNSPYELSWKELIDVYKELYEKIENLNVVYTPYADFAKGLMGNRDVTCWYAGCGFWDTHVWTVLPNGKLTACDRVMWLNIYPLREIQNTLTAIQARTYALLQTELRNSLNGHLHRGGCPVESPDGDWRRASRFWRAWDELFEWYSEKLKAVAPHLVLTNRYPDKLEYVQKIDSGCMWDLYNGRFRCP